MWCLFNFSRAPKIASSSYFEFSIKTISAGRIRSTADFSHGPQADEDGEQHGEPNRVISAGYADDRAKDDQPTDDTCDPWAGTGTRHANAFWCDDSFDGKYRPARLLAIAICRPVRDRVPCFAAKVTDQAAEHVVCCPTQAGFVDQGEASGNQGDEREGRVVHGRVSGCGNENGEMVKNASSRPAGTLATKAAFGQGRPARIARGLLGVLGGAVAKQLDWGCSMPMIKGRSRCDSQ